MQEVINGGFVKLNRILIDMIDCAKSNDKTNLMKLSDTLKENSDNLVAILYEVAGIDDEDIDVFNASMERLENDLKDGLPVESKDEPNQEA